ncbi:hypothetical protein SAMN02799622_04170 [Methylobacterium sp. UNC378MF]|uniref:hypothetical protein n=1 Tax=Methylobacterium sp. UNC378MF TaxID=1502748 RepID=UPI000884AA13|nr:hypothetical protein [Methylobacterium sp. UNC378MF]SDA27933.1 hypothetical protein SAMN02799622_04170 [Methylobacterium sp. UNC378MF]
MRLLRAVGVNLVVNAQALTLRQRQSLLRDLLSQTSDLRSRTGRPDWLIIDEAHQVLSAECEPGPLSLSDMPRIILATAYPGALSQAILGDVDTILAFGAARKIEALFGGRSEDLEPPRAISTGEAVYWDRKRTSPVILRVAQPHQVHRRHKGKYAVGDVGRARSFYFTRSLERPRQARNLFEFLDIGDQVGEGTWMRHLRAGDYSAWFEHVIRDPELARDAFQIESDPHMSVAEGRRRIREAIVRLHAAPAPVPRHVSNDRIAHTPG